MYSNIISGTAMGIDGMLVNVEADISPGLPTLSMVGYLASSVKEAGERVRTAIKNSGFIIPASRITVNLSPADVRKDGAMYDLSIAMAILTSMQIIPAGKLENTIILGELGLSGEIKAVEGVHRAHGKADRGDDRGRHGQGSRVRLSADECIA